MHKLMIKVAVAAFATVSFAGASFAVEQPKIQATTALRTTAPLASSVDQAVRPKLMGLSAVASESRSTAAEPQLGESNTFGMLLAGLAIMGLVVRRRMN